MRLCWSQMAHIAATAIIHRCHHPWSPDARAAHSDPHSDEASMFALCDCRQTSTVIWQPHDRWTISSSASPHRTDRVCAQCPSCFVCPCEDPAAPQEPNKDLDFEGHMRSPDKLAVCLEGAQHCAMREKTNIGAGGKKRG